MIRNLCQLVRSHDSVTCVVVVVVARAFLLKFDERLVENDIPLLFAA